MKLLNKLIISPKLRTKITQFNMDGVSLNPRLKYMIFYHPRSGSSTLAKILNLHPDIRLISEPFNKGFDGFCRNDFDSSQPKKLPFEKVEDLQSVINQLSQEWNGMKHSFMRLNESSNVALLKSPNIKTIYLHRKNLLQVVLSMMLAKQLQDWGGKPERWKQKFQEAELQDFDINVLQKKLNKYRAQIQKYQSFLKENNIPYYDLCYEDLYGTEKSLDEKIDIINGLFSFWGVKAIQDPNSLSQIRELLDPKLNKTSSEETYSRIPNIKEIESELGADETGWVFKK